MSKGVSLAHMSAGADRWGLGDDDMDPTIRAQLEAAMKPAAMVTPTTPPQPSAVDRLNQEMEAARRRIAQATSAPATSAPPSPTTKPTDPPKPDVVLNVSGDPIAGALYLSALRYGQAKSFCKVDQNLLVIQLDDRITFLADLARGLARYQVGDRKGPTFSIPIRKGVS